MKGYVTIQEGCVEGKLSAAPLVSVIVPTYNTERYLDQALESLETQTLRNIEIICVNDGSTDRSLEIMQDHAARDERIRIIDKPNGGYGNSCNTGIREARGTWIGILEPDDWIEPGMFKTLTDYAASFDEDIDIVKSPYWRIWMPDTPEQRKINCSYRRRIKPEKQPFTITDPGASHLLEHHPSIWSALYRREFLNEFDIKFPEYPGAGWADNPFLAETLTRARAIVFLDEPFYCYREETPEKAAAFAQRNTLMPLERWHAMADVYERLGMTDENVMRAHTGRAFTYISGIVEEVDLSHPEVYEAVAGVFARMDDDLVFSDTLISPGWKRKYAEIKGVETPPIGRMYHKVGLVREGLYNVRNTGLSFALYTTKTYLLKRKRREGNA